MIETYFEKLDCKKAYILGLLIFNIKKVYVDANTNCLELHTYIYENMPDIVDIELRNICYAIESDTAIIKSSKLIADISKQLNIDNLHNYYNLNLCHFIQNNDRDIVIEFFKAYYEQYGKQYDDHICISGHLKENLQAFADFFAIPYTFSNVFNIQQLIYKNVNMLDILGQLYKNRNMLIKHSLYEQFLKLINNERPILKYVKIDTAAVSPSKANFSDVGCDITILGISKKINSCTILCSTGLKLDIPPSYYVEIVPRSSIIKSGYMLANSIGIIDCSYKGELFVPLIKVDSEAPDLVFPYKCCQLIMRKQVFPEMVETDSLEVSKRQEGGFGSSG